ncbi:hypothetical protein PTSG_03947 [Salpingoeca rosetta]|uniref:Alpha-L-rhamnosidase six-hairpin glycosidase domain-containing protein n=1 Tax=Salpingoeca rosetta (strain ATCC 50818 / BSB-021) TaxID=946362 RepID=F2U7C2_SALR5|nr:uncharacterized protein PTSG_03947 [Salpingoeca rosetta]EGD83339.1 hypothetical protein PTSG_03947 [Salpingoeca rosetta]|eukprot:XP_004994843.1 hypothetical protein PTSG_03947 [Salpingoeca rosetta]
MMMRAAFALLLVALAVAPSQYGALAYVRDTPYRELVPQRFQYKSQTPIEGFNQLSFNAIHAIDGCTVLDSQGWLLATELGLTWFTRSNVNKFIPVQGESIDWASSRLLCAQDNHVFVLDATTAYLIAIDDTEHGSVQWKVPHYLTSVNDVCYDGQRLWIASGNGTVTLSTKTQVLSIADDREATAVACKQGAKEAFSGGPASVQTFDADARLVRWDWVTNITSAAGGVYDGPVTSMALDDDGVLYVGTPVAINARQPATATVSRFDYQQGLPMNNTQIVAVEAGGTQALWAASPSATMRLSPELSQSPGEVMPGQWRYFQGPRYLLGKSAVFLMDTTYANQTVVVTDGGLVVLEWQWWTLAAKADHYETILSRHIRHGMVSDCNLKSYGNATSCTNGPSDNNGLWTSLLVVAEAYKYALSPTPQQKARVAEVFKGMKLLVDVTGVRGLMARSAVSPSEPTPSGGVWHNSTNPKYKGWLWKGDASSDEVVGHMFAYPAVIAAMPNTTEADDALQLMEDIVSYIVKNKFLLIDVTGNHTRWGVWAPDYLNHDRDWSDERGLNAMQILAYVSALAAYSPNPDMQKLAKTAYNELTNATNQYDKNMINLKIESPDDDNYSDDELTFLPYYTFLGAAAKAPYFDSPALHTSFDRTWSAVRRLSSAAWTSMYVGRGGKDYTEDDLNAMLWNLRTWPLELISWPVKNSDRRDIVLDIEADRSGRVGGDSTFKVLPANERPQLRWNSNPHDLDGGSGMSEGDPGAWLWPYWIARYHGLIV